MAPTPPTGNTASDATGAHRRLAEPRPARLSPAAGPRCRRGRRARSRPRCDVHRVGQAADRAPALVELGDVDELDLKPQSSSCSRTRSGHAGITTVAGRCRYDVEFAHERGQRLLLGEHQRLGHEGQQRRRPTPRRAPQGTTSARRSSSGQKARSRWYIAGWAIRSPRTRTPRSVARCLSASSSVRGPKPTTSASPNANASPASKCAPTPSRPTYDVVKPCSANHGCAETSPSGAAGSACATSRRAGRRRPAGPRRGRGSSRRPCPGRPGAAASTSTVPPSRSMVATQGAPLVPARGPGRADRSGP